MTDRAAPAGIDLLARLAAGDFDAGLLRHLQAAALRYLERCGTTSMDEALGVAAGDAETHRRAARDVALRRAFSALQLTQPDATAVDLAAAWDTFLSRGPWRLWRDEAAPPAGASALNTALFTASRWSRGQSLTPRQLRTVLRGNRGGC